MRGVITLAGEGSRMLPWTRGVRKEFLPLFGVGANGVPVLKPVANLALETLVAAGIRDLVLVVSAKDAPVPRNYFRVDRAFLRRHAHHADRVRETEAFYETLARLRLRFAVQPRPTGFGDAVLQSAPYVGREPFLLHAGDAVLLERRRGQLPRRMGQLRAREDLDAVLLVRRVENPTRYGVVEGRPAGREREFRRLEVRGVEEKPARPKSRWAMTALYCFSSQLFRALRRVAADERPSELEVTSGIQRMLQEGGRVAALVLGPGLAEWRSVGSPEGYLAAVQRTYAFSSTRAAR